MKSTPENIAQLIRELEHLSLGEAAGAPPEPPLPPRGGGDSSGDMERRVARLEDKVDKLIDRASSAELNLATLGEKVSHLPSKDWITARFQIYMGIVVAATAIITFAAKYI